MKIACVGKGGSGKTTLAALIAAELATSGDSVLAIDADINQQLAETLGMPREDACTLPPLGIEVNRLKQYLAADNPVLAGGRMMIKTTPPGKGSRLLSLQDGNEILRHFSRPITDNLWAINVGGFTGEDLGVACYHSKTGAAELLLNHLVDSPIHHAVLDMTAGADAFASGLFTRFDITLVIVEPSLKSLQVLQQYRDYAADFNVRLAIIANKVENDADRLFFQEHGIEPLTCVPRSAFVRQMERQGRLDIRQAEPELRHALTDITTAIRATPRNWHQFFEQAIWFHRRNAESWANRSIGAELEEQADREYLAALAAELQSAFDAVEKAA